MGEGGRKDPFDAALGEAILGYLDALPPEDLVRAFLAIRAPNGVQEETFLQAWAGSAAEREELLSAAKKLQDAGELRRVRVPFARTCRERGRRTFADPVVPGTSGWESVDRQQAGPSTRGAPAHATGHGPPSSRRDERRRTK